VSGELAPDELASMCRDCDAPCCRYYTVLLDEPQDAEDFDELRWFLAHEGCYIYVTGGEWRLCVTARCRFLGTDLRCTAYASRPAICRRFGLEGECEKTGAYEFELVFRTVAEIEAYANSVLPPEELARLPPSPACGAGGTAAR